MIKLEDFSPNDAAKISSLDDKLYSSFHLFAHCNRLYRQGKINQTALLVGGVDWHMGSDDGIDYDRVDMEFHAERLLAGDDGGVYDTTYSLGIIGVREQIPMPETIALRAYNLPAEMAVNAAGYSTHQRRQMFSIRMGTRSLWVCDSNTYFDQEGDTISSSCSCERMSGDDPVHTTSPHEFDQSDEEDEAVSFYDETYNVIDHAEHDTIYGNSESDLQRRFVEEMDLREMFGQDLVATEILKRDMATSAFAVLKTALREQIKFTR